MPWPRPEYFLETSFTLFQWIWLNLFHQARNRNKQTKKKHGEIRCFGSAASPEEDCRGTVIGTGPVLAVLLRASSGRIFSRQWDSWRHRNSQTAGKRTRIQIYQLGNIDWTQQPQFPPSHAFLSRVSQDIFIFAFRYQTICDLRSGLSVFVIQDAKQRVNPSIDHSMTQYSS